MVVEPLPNRLDEEIEVPSNHSDDKEIDGNGGRSNPAGGKVDDDGRGDTDPHLPQDVGEDESEEAPGVGKEQSTRCEGGG